MSGRIASRRGLLASVLAAAALSWSGVAVAQELPYPSKPVRIVVASTAGSGLDVHARILSDGLSEIWKQPVVVENKPGGSMMIGASFVANARPDGYTLFFSIDTPFVVNPLVFSDLPYQVSSFAPISFWSRNPFVLVVNSGLTAQNVSDLLALLRDSPKAYHASSASATTLLSHELLKSLAGVDYEVVTYRGGAEAIASTASGETHFAFYDVGNALTMLKAGMLRALAQTPGTRSSAIPDIPTLEESGVHGYESGTWLAVFAPAKTPPAILANIGAGVREVLSKPAVVERLKGLGVEPLASTPDELADGIRQSSERWSKLIRDRHLEVSRLK